MVVVVVVVAAVHRLQADLLQGLLLVGLLPLASLPLLLHLQVQCLFLQGLGLLGAEFREVYREVAAVAEVEVVVADVVAAAHW